MKFSLHPTPSTGPAIGQDDPCAPLLKTMLNQCPSGSPPSFRVLPPNSLPPFEFAPLGIIVEIHEYSTRGNCGPLTLVQQRIPATHSHPSLTVRRDLYRGTAQSLLSLLQDRFAIQVH